MEPRKESPLVHYELLQQIGDGSFGSVHKARRIISNEIVSVSHKIICSKSTTQPILLF
jgi:serine/threonine protein kinase